ncbi:MAG TPA: hypothetical protein VFQ22_06080 [Longimicrobiales bacterium]|nr:hypothetical protein [Longimicrobiales bacterium]
MIRLELNEEQRAALVELLEASLSDLGFEIADTDRMDFRERLKENRRVLRSVLEALQAPDASARG